MTSRPLCQGDFLARVEMLAKGKKYQAILLREKDLTEEEYETLASEVLAITRHYEIKCILHSFVHVAEKLCHAYYANLTDSDRKILHKPAPHKKPPWST